MRASLVSPSPPPRQPSPPPSPGGGGASLTLVPSRKSGSGPVPSRSTSLYTPSARSCSTCCAIVAPPLPAPPRLSSAASAAVRLFPERRRPRGGAPYRRGVALGAGAGTTGQWAGPGPPVAGNGSRPAPTPPHPPLRSGYRGEGGDSGIKAGPEARPRPWKGRGVWWGTPPVKVTSRSGGTHAEAASSPTLCQSRQGHEGQAAVAGPRYAIPDAAGFRGRPDTPSRGETGGTFAGGGFPVPHGGRWHVAVPPALPAGVPPRGDGGSHQRPSSPRACGPSATCSSWLSPRRPPAGRWALAPSPRFGAVIALMAVLPGLVQLQPFNANPLAASPPPASLWPGRGHRHRWSLGGSAPSSSSHATETSRDLFPSTSCARRSLLVFGPGLTRRLSHTPPQHRVGSMSLPPSSVTVGRCRRAEARRYR